jgi:UPF0716 protein FxsA
MRGMFVLFIIMPIAEMMLLFEVSDHIGGLSTIGLVVLTAAIGIQILKHQGLSTFTKANQRMQSGEIPAQQIVEGLFLAVGGAFLLTPGFITDTIGFFFLIGPSRRLLVKALIKSGKFKMASMGGGGASSGFTFTQYSSSRQEQNDVYEGEYQEETPEKSRLDGPDED